jgi:hypothetical protein
LQLSIVGNPTCAEDIQQIIPGRNPFVLMALEQKWVLFRVRYECHCPTEAGIHPLDIELCIEHIAHDDGGDELGDYLLDNCQQRTKSLLIEGTCP